MVEWESTQLTARRLLLQQIFGSRVSAVIGLAARMDIADAIGDGHADVADLARWYEIPQRQMIRLIRSLVSIGVCVEHDTGEVSLTAMGALLREQSPDSLREFARIHTAPLTLEPWENLEYSLRTERTAFVRTFGVPFYQYLSNDVELAERFNAAMSQESRETATTVADYYDFGRFHTVTDVGGGDGTLLISLLRAYNELNGVIFDTPEAATQAAEAVTAAGLDTRCTIATGDFFDTVPEGSDLYVIKSVLHNWNDEEVVKILRNCRTAMSSGSRLVVVDVVLPDRAEPNTQGLDPYLKDLQMMVLVGGRERTRADFTELYDAAGLTLTRVLSLPEHVGLSLVEGAPK